MIKYTVKILFVSSIFTCMASSAQAHMLFKSWTDSSSIKNKLFAASVGTAAVGIACYLTYNYWGHIKSYFQSVPTAMHEAPPSLAKNQKPKSRRVPDIAKEKIPELKEKQAIWGKALPTYKEIKSLLEQKPPITWLEFKEKWDRLFFNMVEFLVEDGDPDMFQKVRMCGFGPETENTPDFWKACASLSALLGKLEEKAQQHVERINKRLESYT